MPLYSYRAKKDAHDTTEGILQAGSPEEAVEKINASGYVAVHLEEASLVSQGPVGWRVPFSPAVSRRDINIFTNQLSSLISAGAPILKALRIIAEQTNNVFLRHILFKVSATIESGGSFSDSLGSYPRLFSPLYIAILKTGESSGALPAALNRIYTYSQTRDSVMAKVKAALIYPVIVSAEGLGTVLFILLSVMPKLKSIYGSAGQDLPVLTEVLLSVSGGVSEHWLIGLVVAATVIIAGARLASVKKEQISSFVLKVPLYGTFVLKAQLAQLSRTFELAFRSGIKILQAIEMAISVVDNESMKKELQEYHHAIKDGSSLGQCFKKSKIFPSFMTSFIAIGEQSGKLDEVFAKITAYYESDTEEALKIFIAQLEPVMILVIGALLGTIVIAMLLPIFQMSSLVQ